MTMLADDYFCIYVITQIVTGGTFPKTSRHDYLFVSINKLSDKLEMNGRARIFCRSIVVQGHKRLKITQHPF